MDHPRSSSKIEVWDSARHRNGYLQHDHRRDDPKRAVERASSSARLSSRPPSPTGQAPPPPPPSSPPPPPPPSTLPPSVSLPAENGEASSSRLRLAVPSFTPAILPHDLMLSENARLIPLSNKGDKLRSYRLTYDPELDKDNSHSKGKSAIKANLHTSVPDDPRDGSARRKGRREVRLFTWKWDTHSTRPKPPPPPRSVVVSGLSPMTTITGIRQHFRAFGRIEETELKLDPDTGMSTGVAYVCFAHDYAEGLMLLPDVDETKAQRGDLVAKTAKEKTDGQRIGHQMVNVVLDDLERTTYKKTYRDLLTRKVERAKASRVAAAKEHEQSNSPVPLGISGASMPPPEAPRGPKGINGHSRPSLSAQGSSPLTPHSHNQSTTSRSDDRSHARHYDDGHARRSEAREDGYSRRNSSYEEKYSRRRDSREDAYTRGRESRADAYYSRHRESRDETQGTLSESRKSSRHTGDRDSLVDERDSTRVILSLLADNGQRYVFIERRKSSTINIASLREHLRGFRFLWIRADAMGWYVAFPEQGDADRAKKVLDGKPLNGYVLALEVRSSPSADSAAHVKTPRASTADVRDTPAVPQKTTWTDEELLHDSRLLLLREMGAMFMRDLRTRVLNRFVTEFLQPDNPGGALLRAPVPKMKELDDIEIDLTAERPKTFNRAAKEEQRRRMLELQEEAARREREAQAELEEEEAAALKSATKTTVKKNNKTKKAEAAAAAAAAATAAASAFEASLLEEDHAEKRVKAPKATATKKAVRAPQPPSPPPDPFTSGLAEDEEDLYFCRIALEMMQNGESVHDMPDDDWPLQDGDESDESQLPPHASGSARTEGFYRIPPAEKGRHMADRNLGSTDVNASAAAVNVGLASARDNRADSRRFVQGIEQHKKETATDTDILKFNQLRSRKKQLKFAKSPIHDWGLYAMELIPPGDMVIEYVGEIVRQQVADEREKMYERQGNFSTYLFRVDDDVVVDATKKGNIARLMNHCCTPNCNAKILTLNGEKRIVLYAKVAILPGQELTYDYKFQATGDEDDAIACLCGSPGCRRFL